MAHRNKAIEQKLRQILIQKGITGHAAVPICIILGLPLMIYEEHLIGGNVARHTAEMAVLKNTWDEQKICPPKYESLTTGEKLIVRNFYDAYEKNHVRKMELLAIESSIMLCFQTAMLGFQIRQPPLRELDYQIRSPDTLINFDGLPTARWICLNVLFGLIKIAMSGFSSLGPLTAHQNLRSYFHHQRPAGLLTQLASVTKAIIQIVAGTGYIFLSGSQNTTLFHYF